MASTGRSRGCGLDPPTGSDRAQGLLQVGAKKNAKPAGTAAVI